MFLNSYCSLSTFASKFKADRKGVAALEYALMAALVAVAIVTAVTALGTHLSTEFTTIAGDI